MAGYKREEGGFRKKTLIASALSALTAFAVYFFTLDTALYPGVPGESTSLMVQWTGLDLLTLPERPVWAWFVKHVYAMGDAAGLVWRMNFFSLLCGVAAAALVCRLAMFFVHQVISDENTVLHEKSAALVAGAVSAFTFIFSTAVWQGATHLEYRLFDVTWALAMFAFFPVMARRPYLTGPLAILAAAGFGAGMVESAVFIALLPVYAFLLIVHCRKAKRNTFLWTTLFTTGALAIWMLGAYMAGAAFMALPHASGGEYENAIAVMMKLVDNATHELVMWFKRENWLAVMILAPFPLVASAFASLRGLNNERTMSGYFFHIGMTLLAIFALVSPLAPVNALAPLGILPVATTTLVAFTTGYLAAYWYLMFRAGVRLNESVGEISFWDKFGRVAAPVAGGILAAVVLLAAPVNAFQCMGERNDFADLCAREVLDAIGERQWLATNGRIDDHLRVEAAVRGKKLNLVCLWRDTENNKAYLNDFARTVKAAGLKGGTDDLVMVVRNMGLQPFLQDWMKNDPDIAGKLAVYGMPDIWSWADCTPVAHGPVFLGVKDVSSFDFDAECKFFRESWARMKDQLVRGHEDVGTYAIKDVRDSVERYRLLLRGAMGLNGTDLGVALADVKRDDAAFEMFDFVLKEIDRDNISALFNEFELARAGNAAALRSKTAIEKRMKKILDDSNRRYALYSLGTTYGYIRNASIFLEMGMGWARSGMMGVARVNLQRARDLLPSAQQAALLNIMAALYADSENTTLSREIYEKNLAENSSDRIALMGLARLSLKDGNMEEARELVNRAADAAAKQSDEGSIEFVLQNILNNDLDAARVAMQKLTDMNPRSLQAWSMLAGILLQQYDTVGDAAEKKRIMEEIETVLVPRMEAIAKSPRDYYLQITRAMILLRQGPDKLKEARDALVTASLGNPASAETSEMILNADIELDDKEAAERHAREVLRRNREDRLACYVMGSLRLRDGNWSEAEVFLRKSCAHPKPLAAAENDLAECLRRLQRYEEAEIFARRAVKNDPELYVSWETLASILVARNKDLPEAEASIKKAIELAKTKTKTGEDLRMQITLAKALLAQKEPAKRNQALGIIRALKKREREFDSYDRDQIEQLRRSAR